MKRRITGMATTAALMLLGACSPASGERDAATTAEAESGWPSPPQIEAVEPVGGGLRIRGVTEPGGRVVLRGGDGAAFAASADATGRFEVRLPPVGDAQLLRPESQRGQEASPAPTRLLILGRGRGPAALIAPGAPTRRLDAAPALGAIDSDGATMILSGEAAPGAPVRLSVGGGAPMSLLADGRGRWRLTLSESGPARIMVDAAAFDYPGRGQDGACGRRFDWASPDGARLSVWLPTR